MVSVKILDRYQQLVSEIRSEPDPTLEDLSSTLIGSSWIHFKEKCMGRLFAVAIAWTFFDEWPKNPPAMDSGPAGKAFETPVFFC